MRTYALYLTSISCGFCMMALEIVGGRYLQPSFGSGIDVWAAIISVFILSLSIGYWVGGRLADRSEGNRALGWIIVLAAVFYFLLPIYARHITDGLGPEIHAARGGSLLGALILFLPPSLLLGCVSPMLVKLVFLGGERVGSTTGTLYAIGSCGNVLGILVTDFVFLANLQLNHILQGMGVALLITGLAHLAKPIRAHGSTKAAEPAIAGGAA